MVLAGPGKSGANSTRMEDLWCLLSGAAFLESLWLYSVDWHFLDWQYYQGTRCSYETVTCVGVPPGERIRVLPAERQTEHPVSLASQVCVNALVSASSSLSVLTSKPPCD